MNNTTYLKKLIVFIVIFFHVDASFDNIII